MKELYVEPAEYFTEEMKAALEGKKTEKKVEEEKWLKDVSLTEEEFNKSGYGSADEVMKKVDERINRIKKEKGIPLE